LVDSLDAREHGDVPVDDLADLAGVRALATHGPDMEAVDRSPVRGRLPEPARERARARGR
jgi:hypothetical protein